ncbi:hypothetical protein BAE44_0026049 [Dichanthelium oligosanthes]|uniref:F-box domain-containing protein n=1 Tax=Dichanthelium oligosanthes TaxID=888268 RepID=A0A1E5UJ80_9POAL|nr:hypothetical protein BAE44_0026049 [Dichanthelium oligosanthes]
MAKRRRKNAMAPRQAKMKAAMPSVLPLPDDLVDDVFLRLPIRTLAVGRCVSPAWNHRLSSSTFAEVYHHAAAAASAASTFVSVPVDQREHHRHSIMKLTEPVPMPSPCEDCPRVFLGAGKTCHSTFLLGRPCEGAIRVCNPSTGGVLRLPPRRLCMVRDLRRDYNGGAAVLEVGKLHDHESGSWSLGCRIDLARLAKDRSLPWIMAAISPLRYMGGEHRKILLAAMAQTATAYTIVPYYMGSI